MPDVKDCITVTEFAKKAKISRQAVLKMIKNKKLPSYPFEKMHLIDKKELKKYLENRKP